MDFSYITKEIIYVLTTFVSVFVIVDPFAVIPVYLSLTERYSPDMTAQVRRKASFVALGILISFAITGLSVFRLFGITLPAFNIAGGILMLLLGIQQLQGTRSRVKPEETDESRDRDDVSVFPLGTPLLAGPGAISTVVLYASEANSWIRVIGLVLSTVLAMAASYLVLKSAYPLFKLLGRTGLNILTRIMGLILTAVAVQFILNGFEGAIRTMNLF